MFRFQCLGLPFEPRSEVLEAIAEAMASRLTEHHGNVTLAVLDDGRMRELNREYRQIDSTTDVLSFHYFEDFSECPPDETVGEIVFSESRLVSQAEEYGHTAEVEFYRLTVHGILHILGFDHETDEEYEEMWDIEGSVLASLSAKFGIAWGESVEITR